jgi:hypothetical protein
VLSDHEQRALDELCFGTGDASSAPTQHPSGLPIRPPGFRTLVVLGGVGLVLLVLGAAVAALAWATAVTISWLAWRLWVGGITAQGRDEPGGGAAGGRPARTGASIRRYLRWLAEAE